MLNPPFNPPSDNMPNLPGKGPTARETSPLKDSLDPFRAIRGKGFTYNDLSDWPPERYIELFEFVQLFHKKEVTHGTFDEVKALPAKYAEFIARANIPWNEFQPGQVEKRLKEVLQGFALIVGRYLKENPGLMTESMLEAVNKVPRLQSLAKHFKVTRTETGLIVIEPENSVVEEPQAVKSANAEVSLMESMLKVANVLDMLVSSITKSEIKSMEAKERIAAIQKLSFVYNQAKSLKPNGNTFNKINIITANVKDLEKSISDFAEEGQNNQT